MMYILDSLYVLYFHDDDDSTKYVANESDKMNGILAEWTMIYRWGS